MRKRGIPFALVFVMLLSFIPFAAQALNPRVMLDGEFVAVDARVVDGRTLLPVRAMGELVGAEIDWCGEAWQVTVEHGSNIIILIIDSAAAEINGETVYMDVPAQIINGSTFLPLRFVGENLGLEVDWGNNTAVLMSESSPVTIEEMLLLVGGGTAAPPPQTPAPTLTEGLTTARVTRVIDGDTIEIYGGYRIRLIGIDTPEAGQPGAAEATAFTRERVYGRYVWLSSSGNDTDRFGRLRRYVWVEQPTDLQDQSQIQQKKLNALLLSYGHAVVMIIGGDTTGVQQVPPPTQTHETQESQAGGRFIGNRNTQVFHRLGCGTLPAERNRIYFDSRDDAIRAGHRPCGRCNP